MDMRHYSVLLPDGKKIGIDKVDSKILGSSMAQEEIAREAVRKAGITIHRKAKQEIEVVIFELTIKEGVLKETRVTSKKVIPPFLPMTAEEFEEELLDILVSLPVDFKRFVREQTQDRGDSFEGRLDIARDMTYGLEKAIKDFTAQGVRK